MSFEIALIVGIVAVIFFFAYMATKLGDGHHALSTLFILLSFLFVFIGLFMIREIARNSYSTNIFQVLDRTYQSYTYVFTFLVFYFIVIFILNVVSMFMDKKKHREESENF